MTPLPRETRHQSLRNTMASRHLDGILFSSLENIRYLCGFSGSDGAFLLTQNRAFFLTDSRYWTQSEEEVKGAEIVHYKKKWEGVTALLSDLKLGAVGFESASLPFSSHQFIQGQLADGANLVPLENEIKNLRAVKDDQEVATLRAAIEVSTRAFDHGMSLLEEGILEREIAREMEFFMKREGAEASGFDIIVASGKRSALPHGRASEKRIEQGDFIVIDFGARVRGYHSDETCTVICGTPSPEQKRVYQAVKDAHDQAIEMIRPGVFIQEVDAAARDHIRTCGYDEYFGHGTGHGIGLAVHEDPAVNKDNQDLLQEGMVFTVEPGIYIPGWGGVRIEDMVRVTSHGAEVLTLLPKDLRQI